MARQVLLVGHVPRQTPGRRIDSNANIVTFHWGDVDSHPRQTPGRRIDSNANIVTFHCGDVDSHDPSFFFFFFEIIIRVQ